jgi:hypothetical protein
VSQKKAILMRVNIAGYADKPATVFAAYDPATDMLAISRVGKEYEPGPRDGFLKITNQERDESYDGVYTEEETFESIQAFFAMENLGLLSLKNDVQRYNPAHKIERDGMNESGLKYRFAIDITNAQVAVIAACLYANRQRSVAQASSFAEDMRILTI